MSSASISTSAILIPATAEESRSGKSRLEFLDTIRAFAALAVLLEHSCERFFPSYLIWANNHLTLGVFGVSAFFLVSGFIIPVSLERYGSLKKFWIARVFRLYPLYWASILVYLAFAAFGLTTLPPMFYTQPVKFLLANLGMVQLFLNTTSLMALYWTLSLELVFYVLCSLLFVIGLASRSLLVAWSALIGNLILGLAVAVLLHTSVPAGRTALLVTAFFGTVVYRVHNRQLSFSAVFSLLPAVAISLVTGFWLRFEVYPTSERADRFTLLGVTMSYLGAYLLFLLLYSLRNYSFPKPLLWVGQISYSLYLLHGFVLGIIPPGPMPALRLVAVIVLSVALSSVTYLYIEKPAINLHRRYQRQLSPA